MLRIQFELPDEKADELEALMSEQGIRTKKDLFNKALSLYAWYSKEKKAGHAIASVDEEKKSYKEIIIP